MEKRKPELRAVNRAGQSLIRQLDSPDDIEKTLDKLSDRYYDVLDKTKDKLNDTKEKVNKVKIFINIIEVLEVWIEEVVVIVIRIGETSSTEPDTVKKLLAQVQVKA